jgi:hypothetical protein
MQQDSDQGPEAPKEAGQQSDAAPTDFTRNGWLLAIVLGVVLVAWFVSAVSRGRRAPEGPAANTAAEPPKEQPAAPGRTPGTSRRSVPEQAVARLQPAIFLPGTVEVMRAMAADHGYREYIHAAPPRRLNNPERTIYRRLRLFDVTRRAEDLDLDLLYRMPGRTERFAGQKATLPLDGPARDMLRPVEDAVLLRPEDRVVVVCHGEETHAYPVRLLGTLCGIADQIGGKDVFVCWHDYTQIARCFLPRAGDADATMLDAGLVYRGGDVFYDPESESLWDGISGQAIAGPRTGEALQGLAAEIWLWKHWHKDNPKALVFLPPGSERGLGRTADQTSGEARSPSFLELYQQDPRVPFPTRSFKATDPACNLIPAKQFVLGVRLDGKARAYPLTPLYERKPDYSDYFSATDRLQGSEIRIRVTSPTTARAEMSGDTGDQDVMLWVAWKELHPETDVWEQALPPKTEEAE